MWKRGFLSACWEGEIEEQELKPARHIHFHLTNDITTPYVHLGQRDGERKEAGREEEAEVEEERKKREHERMVRKRR